MEQDPTEFNIRSKIQAMFYFYGIRSSFQTKILYAFLIFPRVLHAQSTSFSFI